MAVRTLERPDVFPNGTSVGVYRRDDWLPGRDLAGAPPGSAVTSATVASDSAEFTGLDSETAYVAGASVSGTWRFVQFTTHAQTGAELGGRTAAFTVAAVDASELVRAAADFVCDGVADEVQINEAIDSLGVRGGKVVLSEGKFFIDSPVTVNRDSVILEGAGHGVPASPEGEADPIVGGTLIRVRNTSFSGSAAVVCALDTPNRSLAGVYLRDFSINGNSGPASKHGVWWQVLWGGMERVFVEYMTGSGFYSTAYDEAPDGGSLVGWDAPYDCFFRNCRFRENQGSGMVFDEVSTDHMISECIIDMNGGDGLRMHDSLGRSSALQCHGVYVYSNDGCGIVGQTWQTKLYDCRVQDNKQGGAYFTGSAGDGAGFQIVGGSYRNNSILTTNTYDNINIAPTGAVYGGLIDGVDFTLDNGLDNDANADGSPDTKVRYCINVVNSNMNDLQIGTCSWSRKGGTAPVWGTGFINDDGTGTRTTPIVLARSGVQVPHTGTTADTSLATVAIPGGLMGKKGRVRVTATFTNNSSGNNKLFRVRFGGSTVTNSTHTTNLTLRTQVEVVNRNSVSSQVSAINGGTGGFGGTTNAITTLAINTANDVTIALNVELANAGDNAALEAYLVELIP